MKYAIQYYYGTDLRAERVIEADGELQALARSDLQNWITDPRFWIEIRICTSTGKQHSSIDTEQR